MSKPEDIPQDVWDAAGEAASGFFGTGLTKIIARAIMAARAEERQVFVDMIEQFGSAKLITHCRASIRKRGGE